MINIIKNPETLLFAIIYFLHQIRKKSAKTLLSYTCDDYDKNVSFINRICPPNVQNFKITIEICHLHTHLQAINIVNFDREIIFQNRMQQESLCDTEVEQNTLKVSKQFIKSRKFIVC